MNTLPIACYDQVTLHPLNELGALNDPDLTIQVVPHHEADAGQGRVSVDAPLGRAILRRIPGDTVTIRVQDHSVSMRILAVEKKARFGTMPASESQSTHDAV